MNNQEQIDAHARHDWFEWAEILLSKGRSSIQYKAWLSGQPSEAVISTQWGFSKFIHWRTDEPMQIAQ